MNSDKCGTCRFWNPDSPNHWDVGGTCRIRAPKDNSGWPSADLEDWCGEHEDDESERGVPKRD